MVLVGPPFHCSGPSMGLVLFTSPGPLKLQEPSLLRLYPFEVTLWKQFPPELFATILFWRVAVPALVMPPPRAAPFPLIVLLLIFRLPLPLFTMPPPVPTAPFPL